MPLIPDDDIRGFLPTKDIGDDQLAAANKLVAGWLRAPSRRMTLPDPLPDDDPLYSPAFELVVLVVTNPEFLTSTGYGPGTRTFALETQRKALLADVRELYRSAGVAPAGSFPEPQAWPDPAGPRTWGRPL